MEGKGILFKRFADIDVFDIEVDAPDPKAFIETVVRIAPTFGGINLEDVKAPECFEIEEELRKRLRIPVYAWAGVRNPNILIFPDLQSANAAYKLVWRLAGAEAIGPILLGMKKAVHVLQRGIEVADIVNMAAIAVVDAQEKADGVVGIPFLIAFRSGRVERATAMAASTKAAIVRG